jgi:hypothetical protein
MVSRALQAIGIVLIAVLLFALVEGAASLAVALRDMTTTSGIPTFSRYDELLGWSSIPSASVPDAFGPGKDVHIDGRGHRGQAPGVSGIEGMRARIVCSGDSFVFGEGVANEETWCQRLARQNQGLEAVNLGEIGYGTDQSFLRYRRDAESLEHALHLFAFINADLSRMARSDGWGYGKPTLGIGDDSLVVEGVPVPRFRWTIARSVDAAELRLVEFIHRAFLDSARPERTRDVIDRVGPVAGTVLEEVARLGDERGSLTVLVYLPTEPDLFRDSPWRNWVLANADSLGIPLIDLAPSMRALSAEHVGAFFIPEDGHYTEAGHAWVAEAVYESLWEMSEVRAVLEGPGDGVQAGS